MTSPNLGSNTSRAASDADLGSDIEKDANASDQALTAGTKEEQLQNKPTPSSGHPPRSDSPSDPFLVRWDKNDPENPWNWPQPKKWFITAQLALLAFMASLASSITAPANGAIGGYIDVSAEVSVLTISLFVLGFVFGPCVWGPASEIWGRRWSMLPPTFLMGVFAIGFAVSENAASVFVTRFFMGFFGSAPNVNVSAALGDLWEPKERGKAVVWYAVAVVGGPTLGPTIGAALTANSNLGWYVYDIPSCRYQSVDWRRLHANEFFNEQALDRLPPGNLDLRHRRLPLLLLPRNVRPRAARPQSRTSPQRNR